MINQSIGVDMEEIIRFSKNSYKKKKKLYEKIFTQKEIEYCLSKSNPYPHFTVRFCAKEAALKALKNQKFKLTDIEIRMKNNKPLLNLPNNQKGVVSMSHTSKYAIAVVMISTPTKH